MHEVSGRGSRLADLHPLQYLRPGKRVKLIVHDTEVSHEKFHLWRGEQVGAGNLEMRHANLVEAVADRVGVTIGVDNDCRCLRVVLFCEFPGQRRHIVNLRRHRIRTAQTEAGVIGNDSVAWLGKESRIGAQVGYGVIVEHLHDISRLPMIDAKMVNPALTLFLEGVERGELSAHEREYGLLLIAKIDTAAFFGAQLGYYGKLQRVEVLHLVHLNPCIAFIVIAIAKGVISKLQQVLKVEQVVLSLISHISVRITCLRKQLCGLVTHKLREDRLAHEVKIEVGMIVKVYHERGVERLAHGFSQCFHGSHILFRYTFRVRAQLAWHAIDDIVHEMREEHYQRMRPSLAEVRPYRILIFVKVLREDAVHGIIVYDGGLCRHYVVGEKKAGTKPVDISHENILCLVFPNPKVHALAHATRRTIGKRQAQHVVGLHPIGESLPYAFGKDLRLAAPWRREHEVLPTHDVKNLLLRLVGSPL